jgi:hypothetical protein
MPEQKSQSADKDGSNSIASRPAGEAAAPVGDTDKPQTGIPSEASVPNGHKPVSKRRLMMGAAAVLGLAILAVFGIPWIKLMLTTLRTGESGSAASALMRCASCIH